MTVFENHSVTFGDDSRNVYMFDQLKPIMRNGERYIVVEGGRPEYVLMRFSDYAALASGKRDNPGHQNPSAGEWERANAELEEVRASAEPPQAPSAGAGSLHLNPDPTTIRLEDLPL